MATHLPLPDLETARPGTSRSRAALATGITEADDLPLAMSGEEPSVVLRRLIDGHKVTQAIRVAVASVRRQAPCHSS